MTPSGYKCDKCGTFWSALHYSSNRYIRIAEGEPCAAGWMLGCDGTIIAIDEEKGHNNEKDDDG